MKILFIADQFERGGAGRVAAIQCNGLYRAGYELILVTDSLHWDMTYQIDKDIPHREIVTKSLKSGGTARLVKWIKCVRDIRRHIKKEQPDLIIAIQTMMYLCSYIANMGHKTPIIVADHTSFNRHQGKLLDFVRYHLYGKADAISILTQRDFRLLGEKYPQKRVIYNPLSFPLLDSNTERRKNILCAGRLEVWDIKGFDIIIKIWSQLYKKHPDWMLEIAGDGTEDATRIVRQLITANGLDGKVRLLGHIDDMKRLYSETSIFALPSRIEGFPMVLMEAMSQGCACVAFDIEGASTEMVADNSGIVVKDGNIDAFQNALELLIDNEQQRLSYSRNAIASVSRFSVDSFMHSWETLIEETVR